MNPKYDYRISAADVADIPLEDQPNIAIERIYDEFLSLPRSKISQFLRRLTPGQQAFIILEELETHVLGDGVRGWLFDSGQLLEQAFESAELIGAKKIAKLLRKLSSHFPDPSLLKHSAKRKKAVQNLNNDEL